VRTPVVSAIGHEPDTPLLDLVADVRASTPTDAAKLVVPDVAEERQRVAAARDRLRAAVGGWVEREQRALDQLRSRPALADPRWLVDARADEVHDLRHRARRSLHHRLERAADEIAHHRARARALSPLETLRRGYAVLQDDAGAVLTSVADVRAGTDVRVRVADGRVLATTTGVERLDTTTETPSPDEEPDG
jgi:exodeoxyribonuclease VII large subunit